MAGIGDHLDGDAVAELVLQVLTRRQGHHGVELGLHVEDLRAAGRNIFVVGGPAFGAQLHLLDLGVPALEPARRDRVVARCKECEFQRLDPLGIAQRRIARRHDGLAYLRRDDGAAGTGQHDHATHDLGVVHRDGAADLLPERVPGDHRHAAIGPDHIGDVLRQVVKADTLERPSAVADAARLRRRDPVAQLDQSVAQLHEVGCAAPQRG